MDGVEGGVEQGKDISLSWRNSLSPCLPSREGSTAPTRAGINGVLVEKTILLFQAVGMYGPCLCPGAPCTPTAA